MPLPRSAAYRGRMTRHAERPGQVRRARLVAVVGMVLVTLYAALAAVQALVLNPLAAAPGRTLTQIVDDVEASHDSLGTWVTLGVLLGGVLLALALVLITWLSAAPRPCHVAVISDDGVVSMFDDVVRIRWGARPDTELVAPHEGVAARAVAAAGGGGTLVLDVSAKGAETVREHAVGYRVHAVQTQDDLVAFARAFARELWGASTGAPSGVPAGVAATSSRPEGARRGR